MSETHEESIAENSSTPEIPEESIKEIMFLLPVKSLLKFRCVSPSWLSFIDTPYFLKAHLSKTTPKIILNAPEACYALDINPANPKPRTHVSVLKLSSPHLRTSIGGSCNGALLTFPETNVVLQNPSTRTFHAVPFVENKPRKSVVSSIDKVIYGLGYDALTDDYKVLRICQFYDFSLINRSELYSQFNDFSHTGGSEFYSRVTIYSMRMNLYKQIEPCPYYIKCPTSESLFAGGALHWVVSTSLWGKYTSIASFDVATEKYRLVDQPEYSSGNFELTLHVLGGCLTVVCTYFAFDIAEVWVMKEYGVVESWSKLLSVTGADIGVDYIVYLKPLFYSECGKQVLLERDGRTLLWYDLESKSAEFVEFEGDRLPTEFQSFVHVESLVKLDVPFFYPRDKKRGVHDGEKPNKKTKKRVDLLSRDSS